MGGSQAESPSCGHGWSFTVREAAVNAATFLWLVVAEPGPGCQTARRQGPQVAREGGDSAGS